MSNPKPSVLVNPDPCTALLTYSRGETVIHGAVVLSTYKDGSALEVEDFYIALPRNEAELGSFIAKTYLKAQMERNFYYCAGVVK